MILRAARKGLGQLIVFVDWITRPRPVTRTPDEQRAVDAATSDMAMYQFHACPFCVRTRRALHRLNLKIELRDAQHDPRHRQALREQGGELQVPCLRIRAGESDRWLYESKDIIAYLDKRFGATADQTESTAT